LNFFWANF